MPENSPAKARALRIPLRSHTSDRLAWYRNLLTITAVLAGVGWMLTGFLSPNTAANRYSPGPISHVHAHLGCNDCHDDSAPMREGTFLAEWNKGLTDNGLWHRKSDAMCKACHPVLEKSGDRVTFSSDRSSAQSIPIAVHADNQCIESVPSCAHCHVEHNGMQNQLSQITDANCIECHYNIEEFRGLEKPLVANRITRFDDDHPPFAALQADRGTLKFNHKLHMTVGIKGEDENAKMIKTIDSYPNHGGRLDGYSTADGKIELNCGFCHQPTDEVATGPDSLDALSSESSADGRFMSMPTYEQDCQVCHSMDIVAHEDFGFAQNLRIEHGDSPDEIAESLMIYFSQEAIATRVGKDRKSEDAITEEIELPTELSTRLWNIENLDTRLNRDINRPIELAKITVRASCLKCHFELERDTGSGIPDIRTMANRWGSNDKPTVFASSWFETGRFDHAAHRDVACAKCHEMDEGKNGLIRQRINISLDKPMIKDLDNCVECHQSLDLVLAPSSPGPTNCVACHTYHNVGHR